MHDYPCTTYDLDMQAADRRNARAYEAAEWAKQLAAYGLADLYDLQGQGETLLPALTYATHARMVRLLSQLGQAIAERRGTENSVLYSIGCRVINQWMRQIASANALRTMHESPAIPSFRMQMGSKPSREHIMPE